MNEMSNLFRPEEYFRPKSIAEAVSLLAKYGDRASLIAGGTDVLVRKLPHIECLVDITRLPLDYIKMNRNGLKIGALCTFRSLETSEMLKSEGFELIIEAAHTMGTVAIRNAATVGGNICNALPSTELCPALVALDVKVKLVNPFEERVIPLEKFFIGPRKTVLKNDELLTEVIVPNQPALTGTAFIKVGRTAEDLSLINVAVRVTLETDCICKEARIVIGGGVGPTLIRSRKGEAMLEGKMIIDALIQEAAQAASEELDPRPTSIRGSPFYKIEITKVMVMRALTLALEKVEGVSQIEEEEN